MWIKIENKLIYKCFLEELFYGNHCSTPTTNRRIVEHHYRRQFETIEERGRSSQEVMSDLVAVWDVPLCDRIHVVEFEHGTTTGKRVLKVDGKV